MCAIVALLCLWIHLPACLTAMLTTKVGSCLPSVTAECACPELLLDTFQLASCAANLQPSNDTHVELLPGVETSRTWMLWSSVTYLREGLLQPHACGGNLDCSLLRLHLRQHAG